MIFSAWRGGQQRDPSEPKVYEGMTGVPLYQPDAPTHDQKRHVVQTFIAVKPLVDIIVGYDTLPFVTCWHVDHEHPRICLPLVSHGQYDFAVDWGDGSNDHITSHDQVETTHVYDLADFKPSFFCWFKEYIVTMTGVVNGVCFEEQKLERLCNAIVQWGSARVDLPRKKISRGRRRHLVERRPKRFLLELELRVQINLHQAKDHLVLAQDQYDYVKNGTYAYHSDPDSVPDSDDDRHHWEDVEEEVERARRYSELLDLFIKWQPLGAEFKTKINCEQVKLESLLGSALNRRLCWKPED